jgi:NADPH2 dehydrogenase
MAEDDPEAWQPISPSAVPFGANLPRVPREMTPEDIRRVQADFVAAARRALDAGFEWLELHFAHGYLGQSFLSVHANRRTDGYGGDLAGRGRFLRETLAAVREVWPERLPLAARLGVIEFDGRDEETVADAVSLTRDFKALGLDLLDASLGFSTPDANIPWGPALVVPYAARIRNEVGIPVSAAWNVDTPEIIRDVLAKEQLDLVMLGHRHLANPHYPYALARAYGIDNPGWATLPESYAHWLDRYKASDER